VIDFLSYRWKKIDGSKVAHKNDAGVEKFTLQFIAIQRRDTSEWAIPGGRYTMHPNILFVAYKLYYHKSCLCFVISCRHG